MRIFFAFELSAKGSGFTSIQIFLDSQAHLDFLSSRDGQGYQRTLVDRHLGTVTEAVVRTILKKYPNEPKVVSELINEGLQRILNNRRRDEDGTEE